MKRRRIKTLIILSILIISGCEKQPFDYRNKYLGNWYFKIDFTIMGTNDLVRDTSYTNIYHGEIRYGNRFDEITFQFSGSYSMTLKLERNGEIEPHISSPSEMWSYSGKFDANNKFYYTYSKYALMSSKKISENIYGERE